MKNYYKDVLTCLLLIAAVFLIYSQVRHFGLAVYDDYAIMDYAASHVKPVFNPLGAFIGGPDCYPYRVPLTMLSHMLDYMAFGENYGRYHLLNVFFHLANVLLLFYVFRVSTGDVWKSAALAALFALHPINVEAVAWLPSRVTQFSAFFFMLTLVSYLQYATKPTVVRYALVMFCFSLGLMAKPEIIYLPFVLLLMDYWPLERWQPTERAKDNMQTILGCSHRNGCEKRSLSFLFKEKIPLLLLAVVSIVLTLIFSRKVSFCDLLDSGAVVKLIKIYLCNAPLSYFTYLSKIILPINLPLYRLAAVHRAVNPWGIAGVVTLFVTITGYAIINRQRYHHVFVGWFWFLVAISFPVFLDIFLDNVFTGRYAYIPGIGILVMVVWGGGACVGKVKQRNRILLVFGGILLPVFMALSWKQTGYFKNTVTFYESMPDSGKRGIETTFFLLGDEALRRGEFDHALQYYYKAVDWMPVSAYNKIGFVYTQKGDASRASAYYQRALEMNPDFAPVHNNFANLLVDLGRLDEALGHYRAALAIDPFQAEVYNNLATALARQGDVRAAVDCLEKALQINPSYRTARENLYRLRATVEGEPAAEGE